FIDNDDDVPAVAEAGERSPGVALFLREAELLKGREDDTAAGDLEEFTEVLPGFGLNRGAYKVRRLTELPEELPIEIVPIGDHDERWVLHRGFDDDPPRKE